jgi:hypothetical protein
MPNSPTYCVNCRWWVLSESKLGNCRRRSPTRNLDCSASCWPPIGPLEFCGEHEPASEAEILSRKAILA